MEYKSEYPGIIHFKKENHVAYLRFDNEKNLNALTADTLASLDELFTILPRDEEVWGVIMTGTGRSFISGADLSASKMQDYDVEGPVYLRREYRLDIHAIFDKVANYPRPIIAAINGYALGGGAELALCCDFRIGSTKAKIGFPENKLGSFPGFGGPSRAIKILGPTNAKYMILTGDFFTAAESEKLGFLSEVAEPEELMNAAEKLMSRILSKAPIAAKYAKIMCDRGLEMSMQSCLEFERMTNLILTTTEDWTEGMTAFHEKRTPEFKNK